MPARATERRAAALAAALLAATACSRPQQGAALADAGRSSGSGAGAVLELEARLVAEHPHDPEAWTQGLVWHQGRLYESTGLHGRSSLRRVELETGAVESSVALPAELFGEGLERVGATLVQLTWRGGVVRRYDLETLALLDERRYRGEGWGLCRDGERLLRSDGSDVLAVHDPEDFAERGRLQVTLRGAPLANLNELECAEGFVYANLWQRDEIARIDPGSGEVVAIIDISGLFPAARRGGAAEANGIAYRDDAGTFLVTGKLWPRLFEVVWVER